MRCSLLTPEEQQALAPTWVMVYDEPAKRCPFDPAAGLGHQGTADQRLGPQERLVKPVAVVVGVVLWHRHERIPNEKHGSVPVVI